MGDAVVPEIIRAAGERAVSAYREFLEDARLSASTRKVYVQHVRRFCRWAEGRSLALEEITASDVGAYATEITASVSPATARVYLGAVRGLFRHLEAIR